MHHFARSVSVLNAQNHSSIVNVHGPRQTLPLISPPMWRQFAWPLLTLCSTFCGSWQLFLLIWSATISETCLCIRSSQENYDRSSDLNSYRTISNLTFASKLVERSVIARFVKHYNHNHMFPVQQSAFRLHHSTETAVLIMHNIIRAIDIGQLTVMMFLDLCSAFDTVDHDVMLSILHRRFSVDRVALNWFHSYRTDRSHTSSVGDKFDSHSVSCSVPQG